MFTDKMVIGDCVDTFRKSLTQWCLTVDPDEDFYDIHISYHNRCFFTEVYCSETLSAKITKMVLAFDVHTWSVFISEFMLSYGHQYNEMHNTLTGSDVNPTYAVTIFGSDDEVYLSVKNGNVIRNIMVEYWSKAIFLRHGCRVTLMDNIEETPVCAGYKGIVESLQSDNKGHLICRVGFLKARNDVIIKRPKDASYHHSFLFPDDFTITGGNNIGKLCLGW